MFYFRSNTLNSCAHVCSVDFIAHSPLFSSIAKIQQQQTLPLLVVTSLLAVLSHDMPQAGSITDDGRSTSKGDDTSFYVVYSKNSTNKDQAKAIGNLLRDAVSDPKSVSVHDSDLGVAFWSVSLTPDNAKKVGADSNVRKPVHLRYWLPETDDLGCRNYSSMY